MLPEGKEESERDGMSTHTITKETVQERERKNKTKQADGNEKENCFVSSEPPLPLSVFPNTALTPRLLY